MKTRTAMGRSANTITPHTPSTPPRVVRVTVTDGDGILLDSVSFLLLGGADRLDLVPAKGNDVVAAGVASLTLGK